MTAQPKSANIQLGCEKGVKNMKQFYKSDEREKVLKCISDSTMQIKAPSTSDFYRLYDLSAMQINELQRLNITMESILRIIQQENESQ